jgi:uncharacterized protein YkwD
MVVFLVLGAVVWLLLVVAVLSICRAAARADENEAGRRIARAGKRGVGVGLVAAAATLPITPADDEANARAARCENRNVPFETAPKAARSALICELRRVHARRDLPRLHVDDRLAKAARRHAADMVRHKYFSHYSPNGDSVADRARRTGYIKSTCSWQVGEVLAWGVAGRSTAAATVRAWMNSSEHRHILISASYSDLGLGAIAGTPVKKYPDGLTAAAVFGRRDCSS